MSSETFFKHIEEGDLEKVKEMLPKSGTSGKSGMFGKFKDMFRSGSKIDINKMYKGNTPLIKASDKRHIEIVELLLENGADINAKDKDGATALMFASIRGDTEIIKLLLEKGADVNAKDKDWATALMLASAIGLIEIVKLFLEKGVDIDAKAKDGATALIVGSTFGHIEIVKLLLEKGADVNAKNERGKTALIVASRNNHIETIKLLLEKGADVNIKDANGKTAADIVDSDEIKKLLEGKMDKGTIEMWKGFTRGDIEQFNSIFEENAKNFSVCPICLKFIERSDACMYMKHNCSNSKGYYHKRLYERFADSKGIITWCTICSRICFGHAHYELAHHDSKKKPELLISDAGDPYEDDCRKTSHGGGVPEKLLRFRRLREVAKELQDEIGKISKREALNEVVEEIWNAPLRKETRVVKKIMESKEWNTNINLSKFKPKHNNNTANAPNIPFEGIIPTKLNSGFNSITMGDENDIIQFHHKQEDGSVKEHGCTKENLESYIGNKLGLIGTPNFGYCFLYPQDCKSRLHPEEVKGHIPDNIYEAYKKAFNETFKGQKGGNRDNVFQEAEDAVCSIPRRNTTSKNRNKNRNSRITTKRKNVK